ncbi:MULTISPECIES: palindromic element RPE3 domain-containing protein [unclassified Rickettsia]|uniref:palindromic element RPE3 domain-containing protein n=1 Tax=unclassified Rickettsia TaxID=114295 RepID=UPI0031330157
MAQKLIQNPLLRSHEVAAAIQKSIVILNLFQDLLKKDAKNLFSMTKTRLPRRDYVPPRNDDSGIQLNSESFRQDKFKDEPAQRIRVGEHRRMSKICLYQAF